MREECRNIEHENQTEYRTWEPRHIVITEILTKWDGKKNGGKYIEKSKERMYMSGSIAEFAKNGARTGIYKMYTPNSAMEPNIYKEKGTK